MNQIMKPRTICCCMMLQALLLSVSSCGFRNNPEPVLDGSSVDLEQTSGERVAVADFHYMMLDDNFPNEYAINSEWIYIIDIPWFVEEGNEDDGLYVYVSRKRIIDGYQEQNYIKRERSREEEGLPQAFLVDESGNCYLFWDTYYDAAEEDAVYALEKYGTDGELQWRSEYTSEELMGVGERLQQGTVAHNEVLLYSYGEGGCVFAFGEKGCLENVYIPKLETLEGIAAGKEGKLYGYHVTDKTLLFTELGTEKVYTCPMTPLEVYDGYDLGICLRTGDGVWSYDPETGETERLWEWDNDYIQISGDRVEKVFCGNGEFMILCDEKAALDTTHTRPILTFASITFEDSGEYPGKQRITLSTYSASDYDRLMVRYYNRHSRAYKVEIVEERDASALEMRLVKGNGPDLIDISTLYTGNLAEQGALENLEPYYEASETVGRDDILESVRRACTVRGQEVGVIPAFRIQSYLTKEVCSTQEEWTVWKFLEMGQERRMLEYQSRWEIFSRCMGIRYGEHFLDWEKRESSFDNEDFRRLLELISTWETYESSSRISDNWQELQRAEWLLGFVGINSVWDLVSDRDENYSAQLMPGYPGWDGGEYKLDSYGMFAINSASEYKEGAWDFLEYLLSEEYQSMVNWAFPVRKSSFEACLEELYISPSRLEGSWYLGEPAIPTKEDIGRLREMVDAAVYDNFGGTNNPIYNILADEVQMYFAGDATLDDTVRKIHNRIQTYLDEQ